jgi:hypothetical protein
VIHILYKLPIFKVKKILRRQKNFSSTLNINYLALPPINGRFGSHLKIKSLKNKAEMRKKEERR